MPTLEIEYRPTYWVHPLLREFQMKPSLGSAHAKWADREPGLADLAFSIETRIGNLREIVRLTDENTRELGAELEEAPCSATTSWPPTSGSCRRSCSASAMTSTRAAPTSASRSAIGA